MKHFLKHLRPYIAIPIILILLAVAALIVYAYVQPITQSPAVLMYHLILDEPYGYYKDLFVRPSDFEKQLNIIKGLGLETGFTNEIGEGKVIITLDDGYTDNYTNMFPILKKYNMKATIFVITSLIGTNGYLNADQLREMTDSGLVSIQSHTVSHKNLINMADTDIIYELKHSKEVLEEITGKDVYSISYPYGGYNDHILELVKSYYTYGYTTKAPHLVLEINKLTIPRYGVPRDCKDEDLTKFLQNHIKNN